MLTQHKEDGCSILKLLVSCTDHPQLPPHHLCPFQACVATLGTEKGQKGPCTSHPVISHNGRHLGPTEEDQEMGLKDSVLI